MQQTRKVRRTNLSFKHLSILVLILFTCTLSDYLYPSGIMWLTCLTSQAFSSQKSLPGRPELEKVKVSCAHTNAVTYLFVFHYLKTQESILENASCIFFHVFFRSVLTALTRRHPPRKSWSDTWKDITIKLQDNHNIHKHYHMYTDKRTTLWKRTVN